VAGVEDGTTDLLKGIPVRLRTRPAQTVFRCPEDNYGNNGLMPWRTLGERMTHWYG